jgi:hypothetical protein
VGGKPPTFFISGVAGKEAAMMQDAAQLQVWIETQTEADKLRLVPYVKSVDALQARYSLLLTRSGAAGSSRISQQGKIDAAASEAQALSHLTLDVRKDDQCRIEITVRQGEHTLGTYNFDCPR